MRSKISGRNLWYVRLRESLSRHTELTTYQEISLQAERQDEVNLWDRGEKISSADTDWEVV